MLSREQERNRIVDEVMLMCYSQTRVFTLIVSLLVVSVSGRLTSADVSDSQAPGPSALPELSTWIDSRFDEHFRVTGQQPPEVVNDATFLRRVYLDLAGRIPAISEVRDFVRDERADKRIAVIDMLLSDKRFHEHTSRVWRRILIPPDTSVNPILAGTLARAMDGWLSEQFKENAPYDEMARRLVIAGGAEPKSEREQPEENNADEALVNMYTAPSASPAAFLLNTGGQPANMASSVSRVFLGVRLECAQCHDHPFTDWTQQDFWGVAAFFSGAKLNQVQQQFQPNAEEPEELVDSRSTTIADEEGNSYSISLPWDGEDTKVEVPEDVLPRMYFARWMTSSENPHFAATAVNRIWQHLCGTGLTDSVDDLDQAATEEREIVLDGLAERFAAGGFDVKGLIRAICASDFYQRPSEFNQSEARIDARPLKVLTPEQLFDSLEVAVGLPISSIDQGPRFNGQRTALVARMAEALGASPDEFRSGIPQALTLMNGSITADATDLKKSRTLKAVIDAPFLDINEKVDALFLTTLSREPSQEEQQRLIEMVQTRPSDQEKAEAYSEIMWALINSPEFVLVR